MNQPSTPASEDPGSEPAGAAGESEHPTFCRLCEAFCGMTATVKDGKVVRMGPDRANPHSQGHICIKGAAFPEIVNDPDRVLHPLKRVGGPGDFEPVSWDEALSDIAARLKAIRDRDGPAAIAAYFGNPGAFSTDTFMASKWFLGKIGSSKFYSAGTQDSTSRHLASHILYGVAYRNAIPDLPNCDFLIIIGANPLTSHGGLLTAPRMRADLDAIAARGRIVVIDPRRSETAREYEHVAIRPDTDTWLLAALLRTVFAEKLHDEAFLDAHAFGWRDLRSAVMQVTVEEAAARTGISANVIHDLAVAFAACKRAAIYSRVGVCRGTYSTLSNFMVDALNICTGKFGIKGGSVFGAFPLMGGAAPLDGYGSHTTRIGNLPVVAGLMPAAVMPDDILEPGNGRVRALIIVAGNPVLSAPGGARLEEALESLDLLVSADVYVTESNRHADYILPAATFLEKDDIPLIGLSHMVRPYIQYAPAAIPRMGEAREEFDMFSELARRMGMGSLQSNGLLNLLARFGLVIKPMKLIDVALRLGPMGDRFGLRRGLSLKKLSRQPHGVMLDLPLTYSNWQQHLGHKDGRIRLWHDLLESEFARFSTGRSEAETPVLRLFSQRTLKSMNSWMHNSSRLLRSQRPLLSIHPVDASARQIRTGDMVNIASAHGNVCVEVKVTDDVVQGAVCYPHGWGHGGGWHKANEAAGANINVLLPHGPDAVERVSGTTFIDGIPVELRTAEVPVSNLRV